MKESIKITLSNQIPLIPLYKRGNQIAHTHSRCKINDPGLNSVGSGMFYFTKRGIILILIFFASQNILAATHYVSLDGGHVSPFTSWSSAATNIQDAVDVSIGGDSVVISNGTYFPPDTVFVTKGITVGGFAGVGDTIIDGNDDLEGCFYLSHSDGVIENLTITRGDGDDGGGVTLATNGTLRDCIISNNYASEGGGVHCLDGGLVTNCLLIDNECSWYGGGVSLEYGGLVVDCVITENEAGSSGGGVSCIEGGVARNCTVTNNLARSGAGMYLEDGGLAEYCFISENYYNANNGYGAGIEIDDGGTARYCTIVGNYLNGRQSDGGGVRLSGAGFLLSCIVSNNVSLGHQSNGGGVGGWSGTMRDCIISDNISTYKGGGVYQKSYYPNTTGTVQNCLIYRNESYYGGGIYFDDGGIADNVTICSNTAYAGGGVWLETDSYVANSIVYFNEDTIDGNYRIFGDDNFSFTCTIPLPEGEGNITNDPLIVDLQSGDCRLTDPSPCIDVGENMPWMIGAADLAGNDRIIRGIVDMGVYEYSSTVLRCNFTAGVREGWPPLSVPFTAFVDGTNTDVIHYRWDVDVVSTNILEGSGLVMVTNEYTVADYYTVSLTVSNTSVESSHVLKTDYIRIYPSTVYVSPGGAHKRPYASWSTAATNIQDAVDVATDGTLVLVADGTYMLDSEIELVKGATVRSVNGVDSTIVDGGEAVRCFYIDHANAVIDGFTITNGNAGAGGGVYIMDGGTVQNCVVAGNKSSGTGSSGGGVYIHNDGTVRDSIICANNAYASINGSGGGVYIKNYGVLKNCIIYANWAKSYGSGVFCNDEALVDNCTICTNSGEGIVSDYDTTIRNSILYYNTGNNYNFKGDYKYCCSSPALQGGKGNIENEPAFVSLASNDYHLTLASPCLEAGSNILWMIGETDFEGNDRINCEIVDIGAYEYTSSELRCNFIAQGPVKGWPPLSVSFLALVDRTNSPIISYAWDFDGDGTNDITAPDAVQVSNLYATPGAFTISLTVSNESGMTASVSRFEYVLTYPETAYVSLNGGHRKPFDSWLNAATNPVDAVELAVDGLHVLVTDGVYYLSQTLSTTNIISLDSVNGSENTLLDGRGSVRCIYIDDAPAVVDGFTIRNGRHSQGGGAYLYKMGLIRNCIFISNTTYGASGGGAYLSGYDTLLSNCVFTANRAEATYGGTGGGVHTFRGIVTDCVISNNFAKYNGGGGATSSDGEFINCVFSGNAIGLNQPAYGGAGAYCNDGRMVNCLIYNNYAWDGGGVKSQNGTLENCTIVSNSGVRGGGLYTYDSIIRNCIIYNNSASVDTNFFNNGTDNVYEYCCAMPLITNGTENIADGPLFVAPGLGNFRLSNSSPCINSGTNQPWMNHTFDLSGTPRILYDIVDRGVYEHIAGLACEFVAQPTQTLIGADVYFTSYVVGTNTDNIYYRWDFDNNYVIDIQGVDSNAPVWSYSSTGVYSVFLSVSNEIDEVATSVEGEYINVVPSVIADFAATPLFGGMPLVVYFTDLSINAPQYWSWDFDDDGIIDSIAQDPAFVYNYDGFYTVVLTVSNDFGYGSWSADTLSKTNYIEVIPEPFLFINCFGLWIIYSRRPLVPGSPLSQ